MKMASKETGLPIVSEIMSMEQLEKFGNELDMIQIGAKHAEFRATKRTGGEIEKPILLKKRNECDYRRVANKLRSTLYLAEIIMWCCVREDQNL